MSVNYKKELEGASRTMILIHDPKTLIRLIVRMIVRKVKVKHAAMILYEPNQDTYVLTISRGETGLKIPAGFARFDKDNPLIKLFTQRDEHKLLHEEQTALISSDISNMIWKESVIDDTNGSKELLHGVSEQLQMFNAIACIPAYFQDNLLAILLLGEKHDASKFDQEELDFFAALASDVAMAIRNAQLFEDVRKEARRNRSLFINTTIALASAIEAKDEYTRGHTERVTQYSLLIACRMIASGSAALNSDFLENLQNAALLHDVGKIGIPEAILGKNGPLTNEEYELMKQHSVRGVEILRHIPEFGNALDSVKYHHERYDGGGYPEGLQGDDIPLSAAIIAVADTFDSMTSDRPYRKAMSKEIAILEVKKCSGTQFHPLAAAAMVDLFEMGRI